MADYIITPEKKEIPSSFSLSEELHRRAIPIEMEVHGTNYKWESIFFFDPANPENQCFLERNTHSTVYKVSLASDSNHESEEMQTALIEIMLHDVGGKVYDPESKESYDLKSFRSRTKESVSEFEFEKPSGFSLGNPMKALPPVKEILWIVFSWVLVLLSFYLYRHSPENRKIFVLIACALALIGACGITFSKTKTK